MIKKLRNTSLSLSGAKSFSSPFKTSNRRETFERQVKRWKERGKKKEGTQWVVRWTLEECDNERKWKRKGWEKERGRERWETVRGNGRREDEGEEDERKAGYGRGLSPFQEQALVALLHTHPPCLSFPPLPSFFLLFLPPIFLLFLSSSAHRILSTQPTFKLSTLCVYVLYLIPFLILSNGIWFHQLMKIMSFKK